MTPKIREVFDPVPKLTEDFVDGFSASPSKINSMRDLIAIENFINQRRGFIAQISAVLSQLESMVKNGHWFR